MAGQAGYYAVALDNGAAGIVRVAANQIPSTVGGHSVTKYSYLGTTEQAILSNWTTAVNAIGAQGLHELGSPGTQQALVGGGTDLGTLIHAAETKGSGILTTTPSSAEWDPAFTVIAGGLGAIVSGSVTAAGEGEAATAGAGAGGLGLSAGSVGTAVKGLGLAGLLGATGNTALMLRALEALAGGALILLGLSALTGQADGNPVNAVRSVVRR